MFEKILQKLKTQREKTSNVSDRSLEDLARSLEKIITTDELLEAADLSAAIKSIDGNISHYTKTQLEKIKRDAEEAERLKKEEEAAEAARKKAEAEGKPDIAGEVAKAVAEAMKPLMGEISSLKTEKQTVDRKGKLEEALKGTPDYYKNPIIAGFGKTTFQTEDDFAEYLSEVQTSTSSFIQTAKENGLPTHTPPGQTKKIEDTGETSELAEAAKLAAEAKEKLKEVN